MTREKAIQVARHEHNLNPAVDYAVVCLNGDWIVLHEGAVDLADANGETVDILCWNGDINQEDRP
jgi:hypothetical protein